MINKFQLGGKQDAIMLFVLGLALVLQADPNQIILIAQLNPDALKNAVQVYQQTQDMGQAAQAFLQSLQLQVQAAKHGIKLNYLKSLKHQCSEDEELIYYKKGGSVDCGCIKKNQGGGKTTQKKNSPVDNFKNRKVNESDTVHVAGKAYSLTNSDGSRVDKRFPAYLGKVEEEDRKKAKAGDKDAKKRQFKLDLTSSEKNGGNIKKNCSGSKMKLAKGGICPKCGKIHKAGIGCSIAKFKAYRNGGSLNGIPFIEVVTK